MTTAHRPTWAPAKGGEEQGGTRIFVPSTHKSAKDQAAHTKLKFRQEGQTPAGEQTKETLRAKLAEREHTHFAKANNIDFEEERGRDLKLLEAPPDVGGAGGTKAKVLVPKTLDADDEDGDQSESSDDDSDDDDDEEAELLAELERIKKERAEEAARKEAEERAAAEKSLQEEVIRGNPLVHQAGPAFQVKRRWDDDVVFKNQARGEPKAQKRFINDTIRNDFHRRFLSRYIK
ncbi:hypothetical protein WJX72_004146 [[Myrmecia] bisecta]|uniref:Cwf15/Cwc15 cell cycle control protein n=1 Tax=[Myrmecia] bisecta TaxID=41462 RepID=A0AAW1Q708_9CHLO